MKRFAMLGFGDFKCRAQCRSCSSPGFADARPRVFWVSAAVLADAVILQVPVRQWVLSFPIPLRILFAAHPELLAPVLRIIHRVIAGFLLKQAGLKRTSADSDADNPLASLQAAAFTYRIALRPRAAQKVLSLRTVAGRTDKATAGRCADAHGFSLHAGVRCGAHQRKQLERLCRYITRPAIANERLGRDDTGNVVLQLKSPWRDGTTQISLSPLEYMQRLAALVPRHWQAAPR